jgi:hypothetical protein
MVIHLYKREEWNRLERDSRVKYIVSTINMRSVKKIERPIYNQKRLYILYKEDPTSVNRLGV